MTRSDTQVRPWVLKLARLMDTQFRVPGTTIRFGLDPVLGLAPGVGDTLTFAIGAAMLLEARRLDLGKGVMLRMLGNLAIDWLVGLIPLVDIVFDTMYKAHARNAALLTAAARSNEQRSRRAGRAQSRLTSTARASP